MRKILFALITIVPVICFSQEIFKYDSNGLTDYVVIEKEGKTKEQIYLKTVNWIKETYNSPDDVIKAKIENEKIIFIGSSKDIMVFSSLGLKNHFLVKYRIEIAFKDNKFKFDVTKLEYYQNPSEYVSAGYHSILGFNRAIFSKKGKVRKVSTNTNERIPKYFNDLVLSLSNYINSESTSKKDDW